ncbi:MAG: phospho-sugar mutase, partial [Prevotellaceae bacterium]|nr:phospho-sugar mutase [Prevotellaceae bacterium]
IKQMMVDFRGAKAPKEIAGSPVVLTKDYQTLVATDAEGKQSKLEMPATSNALQWFCQDGTKVSVRPSGTEPKIKFYTEIKGKMQSAADYPAQLARAKQKVEEFKQALGL